MRTLANPSADKAFSLIGRRRTGVLRTLTSGWRTSADSPDLGGKTAPSPCQHWVFLVGRFPLRDDAKAPPCRNSPPHSPIGRRRALRWPQARAVAAFASITVLPGARRPEAKGVLLHRDPYGGRERCIAPLSDQKTRFAGFAVRNRRPARTRAIPRQCPHTRRCRRAGANLCADAVRTHGRDLHRRLVVTNGMDAPTP